LKENSIKLTDLVIANAFDLDTWLPNNIKVFGKITMITMIGLHWISILRN